jgi:hypothetical protein
MLLGYYGQKSKEAKESLDKLRETLVSEGVKASQTMDLTVFYLVKWDFIRAFNTWYKALHSDISHYNNFGKLDIPQPELYMCEVELEKTMKVILWQTQMSPGWVDYDPVRYEEYLAKKAYTDWLSKQKS